MTGLVLKDLLILRKSLRSYLFVLLVYGAIAFSGVWSADVAAGVIIVMVTILPINVFAYDKQCKWDVYALSLPVSRTRTVTARYLCVLLLCLFSVVLTAVFGTVLYAAGRMEKPAEFLVTCSAMGLTAMLVDAIMLPLLYKFGPERARMLFFAIMGGIFLLFLAVMFPLGGLDWIHSLEPAGPLPGQAVSIFAAAAAAGVALLALSFFLSRHFYGNQDI